MSKRHQEKEQEEVRSGGVGGKIEWKLFVVNNRAVSRGKFKTVAVYVINTGEGRGYEVPMHFNMN